MSYINQPGGGYYPGRGPGQNPQALPQQPGSLRQYTQDLYVYSTTLASLLTVATANTQVTIQADSDFAWIESTWWGYEDGQTEPFIDGMQLPITLMITDGGSGRQLFSAPVPISSIAGNGKQPFINPIQRIFKAKSTVNFTWTSLSANKYDNLYFNMIGRKIFDVSR